MRTISMILLAPKNCIGSGDNRAGHWLGVIPVLDNNRFNFVSKQNRQGLCLALDFRRGKSSRRRDEPAP